ncbi:MAG: VOC family protein [Actinomycetota bacterium]|nr:VOC family protein [Actinomycetota bacterium]
MATRLYSIVIDSVDPAALGRWWSDAVGWPVTHEEAGEVVVEPSEDNVIVPALVFGTVPETKTTKNRVHLDLATTSAEHQAALIERLVHRGARTVDIGQGDADDDDRVPWSVLADPEGNELCVLEPRERYLGRGPVAAIVVDAADPAALARFWEQASGWRIGFESDVVVSLFGPGDALPDLDFVAVADARSVKNRVHLDVAPFAGDERDADVDRLLDLGARPVDVGQSPDVTWVVLADPEGNEFCVLSPR